jgi:type IV pilus assembly protein PilN
MARINLLPWRAERRAARQRDVFIMLGLAAAAGALLSFLIITWHGAQIDGQNERNQYLKDQIATLDTQIAEIERLDEQKAALLARKEVIEQLQANRSQMVHLFDSLVRTIPDGVVLTSIKQEGPKLTLEGRSQSNARVSTYMRNLEGSGWMTNPELSIIEAREGEPGLPFVFTLSVTLANPNAPIDTDGDGVPDTVPPVTPAVATDTAADVTAPAAGETAPAAPAQDDAAPTQDGPPVAEPTPEDEASAAVDSAGGMS